jgi:hypothetical protein
MTWESSGTLIGSRRGNAYGDVEIISEAASPACADLICRAHNREIEELLKPRPEEGVPYVPARPFFRPYAYRADLRSSSTDDRRHR